MLIWGRDKSFLGFVITTCNGGVFEIFAIEFIFIFIVVVFVFCYTAAAVFAAGIHEKRQY